MTKYVIAVLLFIAALAAVLLYVGDDVILTLTSSAVDGPLKFEPVPIMARSAIVLATVGVIGLLLLWTIFGWLWRLPGRLKSGVGLRRGHQALDAMEEALIAGSEGDKNRARRKAEKARKLIKSPALARMISAQAAEACGDTTDAMVHYTAMLEDDKTRATGQRGLARQLLATGDLNGAIEHAGKAYADEKDARWAFDILFQAQVSDHRWADARETLDTAESRKHIDKDVSRRRRAVLMTAEAGNLADNEQTGAATDLAVKAAQETPQFAPAVALAAGLLTKDGQNKKAGGLIEKAWTHAPHPALSIAFNDTLVGEPEKVRAKKISHLIRSNADHRESIILKAEEALGVADGVRAWSALSPLMQIGEPTARLCLLAAEAETMLNNPADAAVWMERAATAPSEPDWSDLDPEGEAFDYTDQDWRRLVFSFGEDGELIHPRFERGDSRRSVLAGRTVVEAKPDAVQDNAPEDILTRQPDDPGVDTGEATDDLALRLDSLLGDGKTSKS